MEAVHRSPAVIMVGSLITFGAGAVSQCSGRFGSAGSEMLGQAEQLDPEVLIAIATAAVAGASVSCCIGFVVWIFQTWLAAGMMRAQVEVLEGRDGQFPTLFSGGDVFVQLLLASFLVGLITTGTLLVAGAPSAPFFYQAVTVVMAGDLSSFYIWTLGGLLVLAIITIPIYTYVLAGVMFTAHAVVIDRLSTMEALEKSWELSQGRKIAIVNFAFVAGCFTLLGLLACFVGTIYTGAIAQTAWTDVYLRLTGKLPDENEGMSPG
jgi:hypothetical protein